MSTDIDIESEPATSDSAARAADTSNNGARRPVARASTALCQRPGAEFFDALLWRLFDQRGNDDGAGFLLGVTSCVRQSGVSTVTSNLAIRAADHGLGPVLLIDANAQHPHLHRLVGAKSGPGLAEVLAGQASIGTAAQITRVAGLHILPLGTPSLLSRVRLEPALRDGLVSELRETYSLVFVDLPGACQMSHSQWLAHALDGAVLVIRSERTGRGIAQNCLRRMAQDGVQVLGAVLTDQHTYLPSWLA
jgi:Mrp family chromosome partitioning ATPase